MSSALFAGMPSLDASLTVLARQRLEVISFFLFVLVLSALAVHWLWNGLARDIARLPRLSYGGAAGLVVLWGALFTLVLAMISGARELMTPGAWKPAGVTYTLATAGGPAGSTEDDRRRKLDDLRVALWAYAAVHDGALPPTPDDPAVPADAWRTPHPSGVRYLYVPGRTAGPAEQGVVAYEPDLFGGQRLVLFADGNLRFLTSDAVTELLRN